MSLFKKLQLLFTCTPELEAEIRRQHHERLENERKLRLTHLNLCETHRQEETQSHYAEHNCDYCKLQKRIRQLEGRHDLLHLLEDD